MSLSRLKSDENKDDEKDEQNNAINSAPRITIQFSSVPEAIALDEGIFELNTKNNNPAAEAMGIVLAEKWCNLSDFAKLASLSKNCNKFFQPSLLAAKVYYAAPLAEIEQEIRNAFAKDPTILSRTFHLGVASGTLSQLAVIGLDQTIRNDQDAIVDQGMAEKILELHAELSRDTYKQALENTKLAAPVEEEEEKKDRESANAKAVEDVFDAIRRNNLDTKQAIADFKTWVKNQKPKVMTDNRYHLNLIHLIYCAFDVLANRGDSLQGYQYGALGDQFCFEVIGDAIESELPPRIQQMLRSSLYHLLNWNRAAPRDVDLNATLFKSHKPSWSSTKLRLGVDSYYDDIGGGGAGARRAAWGAGGRRGGGGRPCGRAVFKTYYSNYISRSELHHARKNSRGHVA